MGVQRLCGGARLEQQVVQLALGELLRMRPKAHLQGARHVLQALQHLISFRNMGSRIRVRRVPFGRDARLGLCSNSHAPDVGAT